MMNVTQPFHSLNEYYDLLSQAEINISPSEIHGLFCGLICSGRNLQGSFWLDNLLSHFNFYTKKLKHKTMLLNLYSDIFYQLTGQSRQFSLLLPSTTDLNKSAHALIHWCQGFLAGLNAHMPSEFEPNQLPTKVLRHLSILSDIAQLDFEQFNIDSEKNLTVYETIQSFVTCTIPFICQTFNPSMKVYLNAINSLQ